MKLYMDINHEIKKIAFYWIYMLNIKGLTQRKNPNYPSETAYLLMLISWLQKEFILPKVQEKARENIEFKDEKIPSNFSLAKASSLRGRFASTIK